MPWAGGRMWKWAGETGGFCYVTSVMPTAALIPGHSQYFVLISKQIGP